MRGWVADILMGVLAIAILFFLTFLLDWLAGAELDPCLPALPRNMMVVPENMSGIIIDKTPVPHGRKRIQDRIVD